jgi:hypothetical protein
MVHRRPVEIVDDQITACWLLALDQRQFDAIWSEETET